MIDVCLVIHKNYDLLPLQLKQWQALPEFRLLIADNTPSDCRQSIAPIAPPHRLFTHDILGDDGETHGGTLDFLMRYAESDYVGVCDADFFLMHPDPWSFVFPHFQRGCQAVGVEATSEGWKLLKAAIRAGQVGPHRVAGHLAPCVFCCFFKRELALSETFVVTTIEGRLQHKETGWRLRQKIFDEGIPNYVIPGFQYPGQNDILWDSWFFGTSEEPFGLHLVAGSHKPYRLKALPALLELARKQWSALDKLKVRHVQQKARFE